MLLILALLIVALLILAPPHQLPSVRLHAGKSKAAIANVKSLVTISSICAPLYTPQVYTPNYMLKYRRLVTLDMR